jgi:hypothetical protein
VSLVEIRALSWRKPDRCVRSSRKVTVSMFGPRAQPGGRNGRIGLSTLSPWRARAVSKTTVVNAFPTLAVFAMMSGLIGCSGVSPRRRAGPVATVVSSTSATYPTMWPSSCPRICSATTSGAAPPVFDAVRDGRRRTGGERGECRECGECGECDGGNGDSGVRHAVSPRRSPERARKWRVRLSSPW